MKKKPIKYRVDISWSDEDHCYIARVPELPGCVTDGKTMEEAAMNAQEAIQSYIESLDDQGKPLPNPIASKKFSGKIPLRIDSELHRELAIRANIDGESLNKFIEKRLKKAV
jgi:predicted RNase H-like HicB family nuclease